MPARNPPKTLETANSVQLELGSTLQNYKLRKIMGLGGFSVVYLAKNKQTKDSPSEIFLLNVFLMVLAGLKEVHEQGFLHLDIKPSKMLTAA
jgi:serine/threonine protein kinase